MPVIPKEPRAGRQRDDLIQVLADELGREGVTGEPLIFENPASVPGRFFAVVVWSAWRDVPVRDRAAIILQAYQRFDGSHPGQPAKSPGLTMASGMTWEEADRRGLFRFAIEPNARPEEVDADQIRQALIDEGAVQTATGLRLRYASREPADQAYARLQARLPKGAWSLIESRPSGTDD
jgi:hypothetical protein